MLDPHALAEARSLAFHGEIAARVRADAAIVSAARARVRSWLSELPARAYARDWADLLDGPLDALLAALVDEGEGGRALRQCSPFAGVLDPRTRWAIHAEVARRAEQSR
jgi:hypothetical protein